MAWIQQKFISCLYNSSEQVFRSAGSFSTRTDSGTKVPSILGLLCGLVIICIQPVEQRMEEEFLFSKRLHPEVANIMSIHQVTDYDAVTMEEGKNWLCRQVVVVPATTTSIQDLFIVLASLCFLNRWQIQVFTTFWVKIRSDLLAMNTFSYYFLLAIAPQACSMIISLWKVFSHCVPQSKKRKRKRWGKHTQNTTYSQIIHMISSRDSLSVIRTKSWLTQSNQLLIIYRLDYHPFAPPDLSSTLFCASEGWLYGLNQMPPLPSGTPWEKRKSPTGDQKKKCRHRVATAPMRRSSPRTLPLQGLIRASCPAHLEPEEVSPCWPAPVYSNISPDFSRSYPCFVNHFFIKISSPPKKISSNYSSVFC